MSDANIRESKGDWQIFHDIFLSLESKRPAKSEKDILEKVKQKFGLPDDPKTWPDVLVRKGTSTEQLLDFVFEELTPFVQMVLELYRFLAEWVSTTGGRTTHFEIKTEDMKLEFPNVGFPTRVKWIEELVRLQTRLVSVDWGDISHALGIDNGIFYGHVREYRLIQSLIIGRREGTLSNEAWDVANRIYQNLKAAVSAWWVAYHTANPLGPRRGQRWIAESHVPQLHRLLVQQGLFRQSDERSSYVGIDIEAVLLGEGPSLTERDVFTDPNETNIEAAPEDSDRFYSVMAALFFLTLWRLNDAAFRRVAAVSNYHEQTSILKGVELNEKATELGKELLRDFEAAIVPTGEVEESVDRIKRKSEIVLLPYWKDRWFLYECWTLILPLIEGVSLGSRIELLGLASITAPGVSGTSWNLPTQKARNPVASLSGPRDSAKLLVWFQRETKSLSAARHIEPDVRITKATPGYDDLLILECKDRVGFTRNSMAKVAQLYLDGSVARQVWMVNYEDITSANHDPVEWDVIDDRIRGIAYNFKPGSTGIVGRSIRELLDSELSLPRPLTYLIIDISGSMRGKQLPELTDFGPEGANPAAKIILWSDSLKEVLFEDVAQARFVDDLNITGAERPELISQLATALPAGVPLIIVTDSSGKMSIERSASAIDCQIADHQVKFMVI